MKKSIAVFSFLLLVLLFGSLSARAEHNGGGEAERITATELKAGIDRGENIVIFDVRSRQSHGETQIKGAVVMPLNELEGRVSEIPFGATVAAYCT